MYHAPEAIALFDTTAADELARILEAYKAKHTTQNRKPTTKPKRASRFVHRYIRVNELSRRVGIELTFMPGGLYPDERHHIRDFTGPLQGCFTKRAKAAGIQTNNIGVDPDCVEVSTRKMGTRRSLTRTVGKLWDIAESLGMVGQYEWHGGGGAHVHVDFTKETEKMRWDGWDMSKSQTLKCLLLDATSRPYINYAFANPGDTENTYHSACFLVDDEDETPEVQMVRTIECYNDTMQTAFEWRDTARQYLKYIRDRRARWPTIAERKEEREQGCVYGDEYRYAKHCYKDCLAEAQRYKVAYNEVKAKYDAEQANPTAKPPRNRDEDFARLQKMGKRYGITPRKGYGTVEFRIFQAPNDRAEHELHVDFALAYIEYCEWQAKTGAIPQATYRTKGELLAEWPLERCKSEFIKFCKLIGLDARKYKRYLANMERRFALGEKYL